MALRDFLRYASKSGNATRAHAGQAKSVARKRARAQTSRLEISRQARLGGVTVLQLRQENQKEINLIVGARQRGIAESAERFAAARATESRLRRGWW